MSLLCLYARFESCPKASHVITVKRILRYFVGTTKHGLWFEKGYEFDLVGYCDVDFVDDKVEMKGISGACQFLGKSLIFWSSKKKKTIALSTLEVEYASAAAYCSQIIWTKQQMLNYSLKYKKYFLLV